MFLSILEDPGKGFDKSTHWDLDLNLGKKSEFITFRLYLTTFEVSNIFRVAEITVKIGSSLKTNHYCQFKFVPILDTHFW